MNDLLEMKNVAKQLNNLTFTDYYFRLKGMAQSIFKWENLPEGMDEKWIEQYLFSEGSCMFYYNETLGYMVSKCTQEGLNFYDEPVNLRPVATGLEDSKAYINGKEAILIRNNDDMKSTKRTIELYAFRLAEITRTQDINIHAQRTPVLITGSHKQMLTLRNLYKQYDGFEPVIFGDKSLDMDGVTVLKTDAPFVADKLQLQKHAIWNEVMTYLGLQNANQDKKERLVTDEVEANNEQVEQSAAMMLKAREKACEDINRIFELNIKVSLRKQEMMDISLLEGDNGGVQE